MRRCMIFFMAYCTLGSIFAPPTMRWLNSCHMSPSTKDCIIYGVMLTITAVAVAIAMLWSRGRRRHIGVTRAGQGGSEHIDEENTKGCGTHGGAQKAVQVQSVTLN